MSLKKFPAQLKNSSDLILTKEHPVWIAFDNFCIDKFNWGLALAQRGVSHMGIGDSTACRRKRHMGIGDWGLGIALRAAASGIEPGGVGGASGDCRLGNGKINNPSCSMSSQKSKDKNCSTPNPQCPMPNP